MPEAIWTAVDRYLTDTLIPPTSEIAPILEAALAANAAEGLPSIDVSPTQGQFLYLLAKIHGAKRILEIGTLGGYSTICLARALPAGGHLITLEFSPHHAQVAQANIDRAGLSEVVEIRVGAAADSLAQLHAEAAPPFDMIFIDADKPNNAVYLDWALKLSRKGAVILIDNVIREGEIANSSSHSPAVQGTRQMFADIAANPNLEATALQTVGSKGYDGFSLVRVL